MINNYIMCYHNHICTHNLLVIPKKVTAINSLKHKLIIKWNTSDMPRGILYTRSIQHFYKEFYWKMNFIILLPRACALIRAIVEASMICKFWQLSKVKDSLEKENSFTSKEEVIWTLLFMLTNLWSNVFSILVENN